MVWDDYSKWPWNRWSAVMTSLIRSRDQTQPLLKSWTISLFLFPIRFGQVHITYQVPAPNRCYRVPARQEKVQKPPSCNLITRKLWKTLVKRGQQDLESTLGNWLIPVRCAQVTINQPVILKRYANVHTSCTRHARHALCVWHHVTILIFSFVLDSA